MDEVWRRHLLPSPRASTLSDVGGDASGGINLYMVWNARRVHRELASRDAVFGLSRKESARERWVLALSAASILVVILEALAHRFIRNHTHF